MQCDYFGVSTLHICVLLMGMLSAVTTRHQINLWHNKLSAKSYKFKYYKLYTTPKSTNQNGLNWKWLQPDRLLHKKSISLYVPQHRCEIIQTE